MGRKKQYNHIVMCGYPRSGSTMLYLMLRNTVKGYRFYSREISAIDAFNVHPCCNKITKRPMDLFEVEKIVKTIPNVRFILNVRDPRSTLCSVHKHTDGQYKISWNKRLHTGLDKGIIPGVFLPGLLETHKKLYSVPNYIMVPFESIVMAPRVVQEQLRVYFGFRYHGLFEDFHLQAVPKNLTTQLNGIRKLDITTIDSWKRQPNRIKQQFTECPELFSIVRQLHYEEDDSWFEKLLESRGTSKC